mgnify:CR=1 FL=1
MRNFDVAIVDPPYGLKISTSFGKSSGKIVGSKSGFCDAPKTTFAVKDWDNNKPSDLYFRELFRTSINQII